MIGVVGLLGFIGCVEYVADVLDLFGTDFPREMRFGVLSDLYVSFAQGEIRISSAGLPVLRHRLPFAVI